MILYDLDSYLMFLGMMIDVGGLSVIYWIVALILDSVVDHHKYKQGLSMFLLLVHCH